MAHHAAIPENLKSLWSEEDKQIEWSSAIISKHEKLRDFLAYAESYMDLVDEIRQVCPEGEKSYALVGLLLRSFDDAGHCLRCALSGNYRGSAMYCRDLIEISFLLEYLLEDSRRAVEWLKADENAHKRKYSPRSIREHLDIRDGYKSRKRKANFDALSKLGVHPSPQGLHLNKDGTNMIRIGPFKHKNYLERCLEECTRHCLSLSFSALKIARSLSIIESLSVTHHTLCRQKILEKYLGVTVLSSST